MKKSKLKQRWADTEIDLAHAERRARDAASKAYNLEQKVEALRKENRDLFQKLMNFETEDAT
jgi:hypothetical protein